MERSRNRSKRENNLENVDWWIYSPPGEKGQMTGTGMYMYLELHVIKVDKEHCTCTVLTVEGTRHYSKSHVHCLSPPRSINGDWQTVSQGNLTKSCIVSFICTNSMDGMQVHCRLPGGVAILLHVVGFILWDPR